MGGFQSLWLLLANLGGLVGEVASVSCKDDARCRVTCGQSLTCTTDCEASRSACARMYCDAAWHRCRCSGASALRRDGTCEPVIAVQRSSCEATHRASFNAALWGSPELTAADVQAGRPSQPLKTIVDRGLVGATGLPLADIAATAILAPVSLTGGMQTGGVRNASGGVMHFDLLVEFCGDKTWPAMAGDSGQVHAFERLFMQSTQDFEAFDMGTIRLMSLKPLPSFRMEPPPSTTTGKQLPRPELVIRLRGPQPQSRSAGEESDGVSEIVVVFVLVMLIFLLLVLLCLLFKLQKPKNADVHPCDPNDLPGSGLSAPESPSIARGVPVLHVGLAGAAVGGQGLFVCIAKAFSVAEVEVDATFCGSILSLNEGDVVEILAGSDGWLYGQVLGDAARKGYFPESRVASWLTKPSAEDLPSCTAIRGGCDPYFPQEDQASEVGSNAGYYAEEGRISPLAHGRPMDQHVQPYVCETHRFSPEEIEDESFRSQLLTLNDGDVVEVVAHVGQWLYGHVLGLPERAGYFPESRVVSWMSNSPAAASLEDGWVHGPGVEYEDSCDHHHISGEAEGDGVAHVEDPHDYDGEGDVAYLQTAAHAFAALEADCSLQAPTFDLPIAGNIDATSSSALRETGSYAGSPSEALLERYGNDADTGVVEEPSRECHRDRRGRSDSRRRDRDEKKERRHKDRERDGSRSKKKKTRQLSGDGSVDVACPSDLRASADGHSAVASGEAETPHPPEI